MSSLIQISLPSSAAPSSVDSESSLKTHLVKKLGLDEYLKELEFKNHSNNVSVVDNFTIPIFQIGALDKLVSMSELLSKLDPQAETAISKCVDILSNIYSNSTSNSNSNHVHSNNINSNNINSNLKELSLIKSLLKVQNYSPENYVKNFHWNSGKYRIDKPLNELVDTISSEIFSLDSELKNSFGNYCTAKSALSVIERKHNGDLSTKSLTEIILDNSSKLITNSEYLTSLLIAIPKNEEKEFLNSYETLTDLVVPRSAIKLSQDSDFILYSVTVFKKIASSFIQKSREKRWTPREYNSTNINSQEEETRERNDAISNERKLHDQTILLARTAYSDMFSGWIHLRAIRIFVESVLRYGLPPDFVSLVLTVPCKNLVKVKKNLIQEYAYLAGNAFARDKKGKVTDDQDLGEYSALTDADYDPFVIYSVTV